jgi:hypothetical protein
MRSARRSPAALLALATVAGWAATARASLILALDLPAMVGRADRIAVVDVAAVRSSWNAAHDRIVTAIELTVVDGWKGELAPGAHLTVLQPGGTVGDVTTTVDGMPRFAPGERALVFLHGPPDRATVVGLTQGKRPLHRDAGTGHWLVRAPDRAGADFVRPRNTLAAAPIFQPREQPLEELRAQVRALAAAK